MKIAVLSQNFTVVAMSRTVTMAPVGCWVRSSTVSAPMLNQMTQLQYFHYRQ